MAGYIYRGLQPEPAKEELHPDCGSKAGYTRHQRADEDACWKCRAAKAAYDREWRRARRSELAA